ncbi:uncharacterized protein G2W53_026233 [Senna tora]|uniref:Uncharacterized protein n=1 Tax=Senna tora TaxID=362788 RepID=A0A834TET9_9FABA|nr:uncharacterized protein G2W53_026233 [Senna tora]
MLQLESSWHGRSVDHVLTYSGRHIAVESQKLSRITRQKTCCTSESNTSIRVVFANRSGFDAPIGVFLAWEERRSCLNIFRATNRGQISESFTNYEAKDLVCKSVDHVLTYSGRQIMVGCQKPSRIMRQKTCCASESNTSVRVVFANQSGFDVPIGVVKAWEERGSCLNICRTTNHGQISETFMNYDAKDLLRNRVGMGGAWMMSSHIPGDKSQSDLRNLHELRGKRLVAQVSQTRRFALYLRTGVVLMLQLESSWHGRSVDHVLTIPGDKSWSDLRNLHELRGKTLVAQVSQTRRFALYLPTGVVLMLQLESSWHGRSVDHVSTYSGRQITVGSQKPSRITRQKSCCASESNTSVRVVFANRSRFDAPIGVVLAWEERGSCLNIFQTTNHGQISETIMNYDAKDLFRKSVDHVLTIPGDKSWSDLRNFYELQRKRLDAQERGSCLNIFRTTNCSRILETFTNYEANDLLHNESNTSIRVVFATRSGFGAPIGVVLAWEERGSCLNIFQTTNHGQISETFTNYKAKDLLRESVKHVGSRCIWNRSGFDAPIGVVLAWEERGSCLNIFRERNHGQISETFTNYEAKDLLRKSVDHVLTYSGRQIMVGSQKPSRITRQKTCCARESNTLVRVVLRTGVVFDAPIGVVLAWEEPGSCLNIFRMTNHGQISETFTNYEAKDLLRKSADHVLRYSDRMRDTGNGSARNQNKNTEQEHG